MEIVLYRYAWKDITHNDGRMMEIVLYRSAWKDITHNDGRMMEIVLYRSAYIIASLSLNIILVTGDLLSEKNGLTDFLLSVMQLILRFS